MTTTYRTMTVEHLGNNCTAADLERFRAACEARQALTGESDGDVTEWLWGDGDWEHRVRLATDYHPTHVIRWNGKVTPVMESDGVLYTRQEWEHSMSADWELDPERGPVFQGQAPQGDFSWEVAAP